MTKRQNPQRRKERVDRVREKREYQNENKKGVIKQQKDLLRQSVQDVFLTGEELETVLEWFWYKAKDNEGYFPELADSDRVLYNNLVSKYYHLLPERSNHVK